MTLKKKHYITIAEIIKNSDNKQDIIIGLCYYFSSDNPNFNAQTFKEATK